MNNQEKIIKYMNLKPKCIIMLRFNIIENNNNRTLEFFLELFYYLDKLFRTQFLNYLE